MGGRGSGNPDRPPAKAGLPPRPRWLNDPAARWLWDLVKDNVRKEVLAKVDAVQLAAACRWWSEYRKHDDLLRLGKAENIYRTTTLAAVCWKQTNAALIRLGLSPKDRHNLRVLDRNPEAEDQDIYQILDIEDAS